MHTFLSKGNRIRNRQEDRTDGGEKWGKARFRPNHRIIKGLRLERTSRGHRVQPPAESKANFKVRPGCSGPAKLCLNGLRGHPKLPGPPAPGSDTLLPRGHLQLLFNDTLKRAPEESPDITALYTSHLCD